LKKRKPFIDLLRAIAVILVLFRHGSPWMQDTFLGNYGWLGVDIFFVISGFLIMNILLNSTVKNEFGFQTIKRFYIRRAFKIIPSLYFLIFLGLFIKWNGIKALLVELTFLQSYLIHNFGHTWSISVEEHFYLLLPLFILFITRFFNTTCFKNKTIYGLIIWSSLILIIRILHYVFYPEIERITHVSPSYLRMDSLLYGCLASALTFYQVTIDKKYLIIGFLFFTCCFIYFNFFTSNFHPNHSSDKGIYNITVGYTLFALSIAILLYKFHDLRLETKVSPIVNFIALNSYNIYLIHVPIQIMMIKFNILTLSTWGFLLYVLLSIIIGYVLTETIEKPFLKIRERFS
jgi:peptidoglycan/LPS O-acetylase OafA/YrhL